MKKSGFFVVENSDHFFFQVGAIYQNFLCLYLQVVGCTYVVSVFTIIESKFIRRCYIRCYFVAWIKIDRNILPISDGV